MTNEEVAERARKLLSPLNNPTSSQVERDGVKREDVVDVPLSQIDPFPNHPFRVVIDDEMLAMVESVKAVGVQTPAIIRPKPNGRYEMVSGHRRQLASELAELYTLPCVIRKMSTDDAIISMVDSNHQRETILPSEKAWSYKMKLDAMKRQGKRTDLTSTPVVSKLRTNEKVGLESGDSREQVRRYIRLTELIKPLLDMVDKGKIAIRSAVELSYLVQEHQIMLHSIIKYDDSMLYVQAAAIRKLSEEGGLTENEIFIIMRNEKAVNTEHFKIPRERISRFFKKGTSPQTIEDTIIKALELWHSKTQKR